MTHISPSQLSEFKNCPRKYYYKYILKEKEEPNLILIRGTSVHAALEELYKQEPTHRTPEFLAEQVRLAFHHALADLYDVLFESEEDYSAFEQTCVDQALRIFDLEDVKNVSPLQLEEQVEGELVFASSFSSSSSSSSSPHSDTPTLFLEPSDSLLPELNEKVRKDVQNFLLAEERRLGFRGIIDRIDQIQDGAFVIVDYKTGASPRSKPYKPQQIASIMDERFFQLRLYALMVREVFHIQPSFLSLIFLGSDKPLFSVSSAPPYGAESITIPCTNEDLDACKVRLFGEARRLLVSEERGNFPPQTSPLCAFCSFQHKCEASPLWKERKG